MRGRARKRAEKKSGSAGERGSTRKPAVPDALLRELIEQLPAMVYLKDERLRHLHANKALLEKYGLKLEEFEGTRSSDLLSSEHAREVERVDREILETGSQRHVTETQVEVAGSYLWIDDVKFPVRGPDGEIAIAGVAFDVTDRVEAERGLAEEREFKERVARISATLATATPDELDGAIIECLHALASHLGSERVFLGRLCDAGLLRFEHYWLHPDLTPEQASFVDMLDPTVLPAATRALAGETVEVSSIEELAASDEFGRRYFREHGLKSTLFIPGTVGQVVVGVLVMDFVSEEKRWPEPLIQSLAVPVDLLLGAMLRLEHARRLGELRGFENLVADLCASFAAVGPSQLDSSIDSCLEKLGIYLGAERAFMARFMEGGDHLVFHDTWATEGVRPKSSIFDLDLEHDLPWVTEQIRRGAIIKAGPGLTGLPEKAEALRKQLERDGITSGLVVPMLVEGEAVGLLGLDTLGTPRDYPDAIVERLRVVADVIGSTLVRTRAEEELQGSLHFEALLAELSQRCATVGHDELEREIERWLGPIAGVSDVEHVVVELLSTPNDPTSATALTWNAGRRVRPLTPEEVPWLAGAILERGKSVSVGALTDLPPQAEVDRDTFESVGIKAFLSLPLRRGERAYGRVSFCALSRERSWSEDLRRWLGLIAGVFANALARRYAQRELRQALGQSTRAEASLREALAENERLKQRLEHENLYLRRQIDLERGAHRIVGESPALLQVLDEARQVAETDSTVLITGETGTGKELLARLIHETSARSGRTLVKVNCATLPETLVESELFGRDRGAYTGAMTSQAGRFELADKSTIFLDEIGEVPLATQVKLLRVIEEGRFERLGRTSQIEIDVRVIAATNRDLPADVAAGRFRKDLFYRLNVFPLSLPPLRERPGDVPLLTWFFVQEIASSMDRSIEGISRNTMSRLESYSWPGNIRELRNVIERALILSRGPILEVELPAVSKAGVEPAGDTSLDGAQRRHVLSVLETTGWRVSGKGGAADILGIKPSTLYSRMKKLGIRRPG